jgi:hypothetical protein
MLWARFPKRNARALLMRCVLCDVICSDKYSHPIAAIHIIYKESERVSMILIVIKFIIIIVIGIISFFFLH